MNRRTHLHRRLGITAALVIIFLLSFSAMAGAVRPMPQFSLPSATDGKTVSSDDFKNKTLLVTFFATWCPPCRQEIPTLIKLQNEYADKDFSIVALSVDEGGPKVVKKLIDSQKINYPVLMATRAVANNFGGISGIPTTFLVNKKGNVVKKYPGYVPHQLLVRDINTVLQ